MINSLFMLMPQIVKFSAVGLVNTAVSLLIYYLFICIDPNLYIWGNIAGFLGGTLNAYLMNSRFVFLNNVKHIKNYKQEKIKRIIKTYMTYGATMLFGVGLLYFWVGVLHVSEMTAPLINLMITIPLNFCLNKFWIYKDYKDRGRKWQKVLKVIKLLKMKNRW